jgi:pSer/pThr/pTyr-binding forkhead associated (FHA) protein
MNQDLPLGDGEHVIGREPSASVHVPASVVSRRHARLVVTGDTVTLEDLSSKNGTFIGKTRLQAPQPLRDGDEIRIGDLTLTFRAVGITPTKTY